MNVDANPSSAPNPVVAEHKKPISTEHNPDPKTAISEILNQPNQSPNDIFKQLAAIDPSSSEAAVDNPIQQKQEAVIIDPQPETPSVDTAALQKEDVQQTAKYIEQVTQIIQQESTPKIETVSETPKTLFPDSPPLYDKYHKTYEREKKTIKGALTRSHDIRLLRKDYANSLTEKYQRKSYYDKNFNEDQKGAANFYDALRSRGVSRSEIMAKDSDGQLIINKKLSPNSNYTTGVQRLDSLGLFRSFLLYSDKTPTRIIKDIQKVTKMSESDFNNAKDQLNQYSFLSSQDIVPFLTNNYYQEQVNQALSSIQKDFFSSSENQQKLADFLKQHPNENLFKFVLNISTNGTNDPFVRISPFIGTLIDADINHGEKITISNECKKAYSGPGETSWLQYQNLYSRDQQNFLLKKSRTLSKQDFVNRYFGGKEYKQEEVSFNFYKDYIIQSAGLGEEGNRCGDLNTLLYLASEKSLSTEDRSFYKNVLNISRYSSENVLLQIISNKDKSAQYFGENSQPTPTLFEDVIKNTGHDACEFVRSYLTSDLIEKTFLPKDQIFWTNIKNLLNNSESLIPLEYIFRNDSHLNSEGKLTSEYFKNYLTTYKGLVSLDFITTNLTPDLIMTFPLNEDRIFWNNILNIKSTEKNIPFGLILSDKSYLSQEGVLTFQFFKKCLEESYSNDQTSLIKLNLTSDLIKTFPSAEERQVWTNMISLNKIDSTIYAFLNNNQDQINSYFTQEHTPTSLFFQDLITSNNYHLDINFLHQNLTSDLIKTFPLNEDRIFWNTILGLSDTNVIKLLVLNKSDYLSLLNEDLSINSLFLKKYITLSKDIPLTLLDQDFLDHRSKTELPFWENIKKSPENNRSLILDSLITESGDILYDHPFYKAFSQEKPTFFTSDFALSQEIVKLLKSSKLDQRSIYINEINQLQESILSNPNIKLNQQNWQPILMTYIQIHEEMGMNEGLPQISSVVAEKINQIFSESTAPNFCLKELQSEWIKYLNSNDHENMPSSIYLVSKFIKFADGAGPLSQIESLMTLADSVSQALEKSTTVPRTKTEIIEGLFMLESRFNREKWSNEDKNSFYNISVDIINAAPSLFSDYITLFKKFTPDELRRFSEEIYPLYKTKLVLIEQKSDVSNYQLNDLVTLRQQIRNFTSFQSQKEELFLDIKNNFKDRFGLLNIPENFSQESVRSIGNISTYLSNINDRDSEKEAILGYYLSLMVNDKWNSFRNGESFNAENYLSREKSTILDPILAERQNIITTLANNVGIDATEESSEFIRVLQNESQTIHLGDVNTIDIKLNNITKNLEELQDLDLYPEMIDKERMQLLQTWGNKKIGSVTARLYQQAVNPSKEFVFSEEELQIKKDIERICQTNGININDPEKIKSIFQDGIKQFSVITNISNTIKDLDVVLEIEHLREKLDPPADVIRLFSQLGEKFETSSGVIPVSQDIDYLENLLVKNESTITTEDKEMAMNYITSIRSQIVKLEEIYGQIKSKFENIKQGNSSSSNELLNQKLEEINKILNQSSLQQPIVSIGTNNLNDVVENIRACLSCTQKGANNDTDLTFGDVNKFYLYSKINGSSKGSISDQLAYLEPIIKEDGSKEVSFILDNLYGTRNPAILEGHIDVLLKKVDQIKTRFPKSKISIFISEAALNSSGTAAVNLIKKYQSSGLGVSEENIDVDVLESSFGDHYIEIGGWSREAGIRRVKGIILRK